MFERGAKCVSSPPIFRFEATGKSDSAKGSLVQFVTLDKILRMWHPVAVVFHTIGVVFGHKLADGSFVMVLYSRHTPYLLPDTRK